MLNETNANATSKINLKNVELFLLRILAGIDPNTAKPLGADSVWKHPEIMSALLKLVREGKEALEEDAESNCLFPF
jgi:CO dehydrogenase/acetyl-CoA synthase alpha subunit